MLSEVAYYKKCSIKSNLLELFPSLSSFNMSSVPWNTDYITKTFLKTEHINYKTLKWYNLN